MNSPLIVDSPVIVVVGAGPGVGSAVARRFGRRGYAVGLVARSVEPLAALGEHLQAEGITVGWCAADAGDPQALREALEQLAAHTGRVDVLLHNAVRFRPARAGELTAIELLDDLAVGTASLLTSVQAVLPYLRRQGAGTVLATGSGAADHPMRQAASLGVQKAALRALVAALADDLAGEGVHVATVTVRGSITPDGPLSPGRIAEVLHDLAAETAGPRESWRTVVDLKP